MILNRIMHEYCEDNNIDISTINLTLYHIRKIAIKYGPAGKGMIVYVPEVLQDNWRQWYVNPHGHAGIHTGWHYLNKKEKIACEFCEKKKATDKEKNQKKYEVYQTTEETTKQQSRDPVEVYKVEDHRIRCPDKGCNAMMSESRYLKNHGKSTHKTLTQEQFDIDIKFACPFCREDVSSLTFHKRVCPARDGNKMACQYCGKVMLKHNLKCKHIKNGICPQMIGENLTKLHYLHALLHQEKRNLFVSIANNHSQENNI